MNNNRNVLNSPGLHSSLGHLLESSVKHKMTVTSKALITFNFKRGFFKWTGFSLIQR